MARRRYESTLQTVKDINITPLMDLTFLLLIVFMITAPMLEYEVDVSPPKYNTTEIEEDAQTLMVNLTGKGDILFKGSVLSIEGLRKELRFLSDRDRELTALIRADGERPYKEVIELMQAVNESNIPNVSLVTQQEE